MVPSLPGKRTALLNNGRSFDYYLIPTETAGVVTILAKINQKNYVVKTTLPPLRAGSLTQINLHKTANGLDRKQQLGGHTSCHPWQ